MAEYGMVIDLTKCVRCRTCYIACKIAHEMPVGSHGKIHPQEHRRLWFLEFEHGHYPKVRRIFIPIPCMSCKEPACKNVCPTGAINIDDKGVVRTDYSKCTLCLKCVYSCPYGARVYWPDMGIVDSCDFCADRGYKPYCSEMCPGEAIHFGDFSDRGSKISEFLKGDLAKPIIIEGYDVRPKVYYIAPHKEDLEEAAKYLKSRMLEGKNNE